jgi:cytochrome d ubiquinol oxidase subunit II
MLANFSFGKISSDALHPIIINHQNLISGISWIVIVLNIFAIANIPRCLIKGLEIQGFISSASTVLAVVLFFALGMFPKMLISSTDKIGNLTIYNGASSIYTLKTMFWVAIWGMPFVIGYTSIIYWTFRGKTKLNAHSY